MPALGEFGERADRTAIVGLCRAETFEVRTAPVSRPHVREPSFPVFLAVDPVDLMAEQDALALALGVAERRVLLLGLAVGRRPLASIGLLCHTP
jgi:hypothetical protein